MTRFYPLIFLSLTVFSFHCANEELAPSSPPIGQIQSALFTCSPGPNQVECEALVRLYTLPTVSGPTPRRWLVDSDICTWEGVGCWSSPSGRHVNYLSLPFQVEDLPPNSFEGLSYLKVLYVGDASEPYAVNVETIQKGAFIGLSSLENLLIYSDRLALRDDIFQGLDNLEVLALYRSSVTEISLHSFRGLLQLKGLNLGGVLGVDHLEVGIFDGLVNLEWLNLGGMDLKSLPVGLFKDLNSLTWLSLITNSFSGPLGDGVFSGLNHLNYLQIYNNPGLTGTSLPRELCILLAKGLVLEDRGNKMARACGILPPPPIGL